MNQEAIMADLHTIKVANFRFRPSAFFKLQSLSFKPSKKSTSSTSHLCCETMFLQSSQPPTLAISRAITPPECLSPINSLPPDDKVFNQPRFLETVKERPPIQVGFRGVLAGQLGSSQAMSVRIFASPSRGLVLKLIPVVSQRSHPPLKAEDESVGKEHCLCVLVEPDVLKNVRRVELVSLLYAMNNRVVIE